MTGTDVMAKAVVKSFQCGNPKAIGELKTYPIPKPIDIICPKCRFPGVHGPWIKTVVKQILNEWSVNPWLGWSNNFDDINRSSDIGYVIERMHDHPKNQE